MYFVWIMKQILKDLELTFSHSFYVGHINTL